MSDTIVDFLKHNKGNESVILNYADKYKYKKYYDDIGYLYLYFPEAEHAGWIMCNITSSPYFILIKKDFIWKYVDGSFMVNLYDYENVNVNDKDYIEERIKKLDDSYKSYCIAKKEYAIQQRKNDIEKDFENVNN